MAGVEHLYRYVGGSSLDQRETSRGYLATSGGDGEHPHFFRGFLSQPRRDAALLLAVAEIAGARFYTPSATTAAEVRASDPVVTCDGDRLRFESFSLCNGVYARVDLEAIEGEIRGTGTTNVDFNAPFQHSLAGVRRDELVHLAVGADEVTLDRLGGAVSERRVTLPERWLRGFAEVAMIQECLRPQLQLDRLRTRRFLSQLARHPKRDAAWLAASTAGPALTDEPAADSTFIAGLDRLRPLAPFAAHAQGLVAFGATAPGSASAWVLDLGDARLTLALSPARDRGFSAEGTVLLDLTDPVATARAAGFRQRVVTGPSAQVLGDAGSSADEAERRSVLGVLSAAGLVGFDVAAEAWFTRALPFDIPPPERLHRRLGDARRIAEAGGVTPVHGMSDRASVRSADSTYEVTVDGPAWTCTCAWATETANGRGPCKHVLATRLALHDEARAHG